jgi:sugar lactone lactonase YvrE
MNKVSRMVLLTSALLVVVVLPSVAQWSDGQDAEYVLGRPDFTTAFQTGAGTTNFYNPDGIAIDVTNHKLYVSDPGYSRILRFPYPITQNNPVADLVFGQTNFTSTGSGIGSTGLSSPLGLAVYNGDLWVSDDGNCRVLKYANAYAASSNGPSASVVLGQADFSGSNPGTAQNKLSGPTGLTVDGSGNLWVVDANNNRVLKYANASSKTNGANADIVLGQSNFTSSGSGTTQSTMKSPFGVTSHGSTLWVSESGNYRVLRFDNAASKSNGANADGVLGQANFTATTYGTSSTSVKDETGIAVDGNGTLYVGDSHNQRVLVFNNAASKLNGAAADNVLGQSSFTTYSNTCTQSVCNLVRGVAVDGVNNKLLVVDWGHYRVLQFAASGPLPIQLSAFSATASVSGATLSWHTVSEVNDYGFYVQMKRPGEANFSDIAGSFVAGHGTTNDAHDYSYTVTTSDAASAMFRLKQVDLDGSVHYSEAITAKTTTGVAENTPLSFSLDQNYPNPFNPTTTIAYSLPKASLVKLTVYDALGREVSTLVNESKQAGRYQATFNAGSLASGTYVYRIQAGNFTDTKRFVLVK